MTFYPTATMTINSEAHEVRDVVTRIEHPPGNVVHMVPLEGIAGEVEVTLRCESRSFVRYLRLVADRARKVSKRYRALEPKWKSETARFAARLPGALDMTERGYRPKDRLPRGRRQNLRNGPPVSSRDFAEAFG